MKFKKKTAVIISFALGTIMFATTAIAQVVTKSGYDQLKDSMKYTAESCTTKLSNYTMDLSFAVKDNGKVLFSESSLNKIDASKQAIESSSTQVEGSTKREDYSYSDKNGRISKGSDQNIYYITEYTPPHEDANFKNPFKEKEAGDIEKIADALVGSLKDAVVVTENPDGSKTLSGSLNESQIPALINAVVSYQSKQEFGHRSSNGNNMPKITSDVFVKEVKGNMITSKDGLIQSILGTGVISGKDESGKEHTLTFELLGKMSNVNSTKVTKPDLSGKEVEKNPERDYSKLSNPEKYIGKYKTDIILEKDAKFIKVGERFVNIEQLDDKGVSGRYYEEYAKGYEEYGTNKKDFKFDAKFDKDNFFNAPFTASSSSNATTKGNISINQNSAKIYFYINDSMRGNLMYDDQYNRIFD